MTRLVFITQRVDPEHPALAATVPKLRALARRVDEVVVLALDGRPDVLPENCTVRLFGRGGRPARVVRLERDLHAALSGGGALAVVAHMVPVYAVLAAPLARVRKVPLLLWYTHWKATAALRVAERLVDGVVSVDRRSFPLDSEKVRGIGHGIDLGEFTCRPPSRPGRLRVLALGRYSPSKGYDALVRAAAAAAAQGLDLEVRVVGPTLTEEERRHKEDLARLCASLGVADRVVLTGPVPRGDVPRLFESTDVFVNNMRAGAPDKVVYEAAAACVPVLASNPVLADVVAPPYRFDRDRPEHLVEALVRVASLPAAELERSTREARDRVAAAHSVYHWAEALLAAARRS